jgi:hypothetical protein
MGIAFLSVEKVLTTALMEPPDLACEFDTENNERT